MNSPSILRRVLFAFLSFGTFVACVFPFYANFFVEWKEGMLPWFVLGCLIAGLFIGVVNYWVMNIVLVSKLRRISHVAGAIANKDLSFTCAMQSNDTIGEIIDSFNNMSATLRDLISKTSSLSSQVRSGSDGIRSQAGQIHDRVDILAERSRQISAAIQALDTAVAEISLRSQHAADQAGEAGNTARAGVGVARESIEGMERIHNRVSSATERVELLGKSSQEVGAIVSVIKEIADQTNLLALNAAIEAARAGEQGRGFAVVADEVRKLAEKTGQATTEIGQMINTIQAETGQAIEAISQGMTEAQAGVGHVRRVGESLERIIQVVDQVVTLVGDIAQATASQKSAVESARDSVAAIEQLNAQTLSDSVKGVNMTADLTAQANSLDEAVKSFKLG
ncbi:MAG: methyl-accepting chemotaxis protein [Thiobacillaceae bacterium]|jgi:methyl-accepting chemotaxis protein|nr:methyl-accepting chemotaxis protein [Thiobacillaceae bacterium]